MIYIHWWIFNTWVTYLDWGIKCISFKSDAVVLKWHILDAMANLTFKSNFLTQSQLLSLCFYVLFFKAGTKRCVLHPWQCFYFYCKATGGSPKLVYLYLLSLLGQCARYPLFTFNNSLPHTLMLLGKINNIIWMHI